MNRMVEEQRTQIGVLKALGYGKAVIMSKYLFYSGSAAVLGCVSGYLLGTILFPKVIWNAYGMMYQVAPIIYVFDWSLAIISIVVALICSIGTTWFTCRYELAEVAAQLMRPKTPKAGKRVILEYIPFLWKRLKFLQKVSLRNVLRYKKRFLMMIIGISGCSALVLTGFGIKDSIAEVTLQQFNEIQIYDINASFKNEIEEDLLAVIEEVVDGKVTDYDVFMEKTIDMHYDNHIKSMNLIIPKNVTEIEKYIDLHTKKGTKIEYPGIGEAVISLKIADTYHIEIGDSILLMDEDRNEIPVVVSGINQNFLYNYVYIHPQTYEDARKEAPTYKTIYFNLEEAYNGHQLLVDLMKLDEVSSVSLNADTMERFTSMMDSLDYIVLVVILCAGALAFIVLYNLTNINITERIREIATIKVLGFYKKETSSYVFRENKIGRAHV